MVTLYDKLREIRKTKPHLEKPFQRALQTIAQTACYHKGVECKSKEDFNKYSRSRIYKRLLKAPLLAEPNGNPSGTILGLLKRAEDYERLAVKDNLYRLAEILHYVTREDLEYVVRHEDHIPQLVDMLGLPNIEIFPKS